MLTMNRFMFVLLVLPVTAAPFQDSTSVPRDGQIIVPPDRLDAFFYAGSADHFLRNNRRYDLLVLSRLMEQRFNSNVPLDEKSFIADLTQVQNEYNRREALAYSPNGYQAYGSEKLRASALGFDIASDVPGLKIVSSVARRAFDQEVEEQNNIQGAAAQITSRAQQSDVFSQSQEGDSQLLLRLVESTRGDATKARIVDHFLAVTGASVNQKAATIMRNNPAFVLSTTVQGIAHAVGPDGSLVIGIDRLKQMFVADMKAVEKINAQQSAAAKKVQDRVNHEQDRADHELTISAARSALTMLAYCIPDRKAARDITVGGSALISMAEAMIKFSDTTTTKAATNMSAIVATGSIFAGAASLFSLFGEGGQSPDQMILSELVEIRKAIAEFHKDMSYRFDRVDITLAEMYNGLSQTLNLIDARQRRLEGRVADVQLTLLRESQQLNRLHRNMFDYLNDLSLRSINKGVSYCLDYSRFYPSLQLSEDDYRRCQIDFVSWATSDSRDHLSNGAFASLDDPLFSSEMRAWPLAAKINVLATTMQHIGLNSIGQQRTALPNPIVWATGAEAYMQLAANNRPLYERYSTEAIDRLIASGEELDAFLASFTRLPGQSRQANVQFTRALISGYRSRSAGLVKQLEQLESNYISRDAHGVILWGDPNHSSDYVPEALTVSVPAKLGTDANHFLPLTAKFAQYIPVAARQAEKLGLGKIHVSIDVQYPERIVVGLGRKNNDSRAPDLYQIRSRAVITATTRFDQAVVATTRVTPDKQFDLCVVSDNGDCNVEQRTSFANSITLTHWTANEQLASQLESGGAEVGDATKTLADVTAIAKRVSERVLALRKNFYAGVLAEISSKTELYDAAELLSGYRDLIELYAVFVLPETLDSNENLRGSIYGNQRIWDREALVQLLASSARDGKRIVFTQLFERGLGIFAREAEIRISEMAKIKSHEQNRAIETTIQRLKAFRRDHEPVN